MVVTTIPNPLDVAARAHGSRIALSFSDRQWSFAALRASVISAARIIEIARSKTQRPGRIGIVSANRPGYVFAVHAAANLATSVVPLNWRLMPAELSTQIREADIGLLLVDEPRMEAAYRATSGIPIGVLPIGDLEQAPPRVNGLPLGPAIDLADDAVVIFTSGTTGQPKGARITYGNLWFSAVASSLYLDQRSDDTWLAALSLHHIGGLSILYRGLIDATHVVLLPRFDPHAALEAIDRGVTHVSLVPTMLQQMIAPRGDMPWAKTLRCLLLGGAAAPPDLLDSCFARGIPVAPTYGLTESSSQATTLLPETAPSRPGSSGLPLPTTQLRIVEEGRELPVGCVGEIELRGPTIFAGYLGDGAQHEKRGGWLATGDAGYVDEEGYLYVVDRREDLIVSGGENVYPAEIERALLAHPLVLDAGVVGLPDEKWGARPAAAIVWSGISEDAESELLAHCRSRLASYKMPDHLLFVDKLPRSSTGKLLRKSIREVFRPAAGKDQEAKNAT